MSVLSSLMPLSPPLFWQEASELSSLMPQLEELGVPLVAVVKENIGTEIQDFRPHFAGDIYIDEQVSRTSQLQFSVTQLQKATHTHMASYKQKKNLCI